jgi:carbamoyltransferase
MIKMRDFWMPFAPSMMADRQSRYLKNPKRLASPFMMFAFETLPLAEEHLGAAIHPRDRTARAQLVTPEQNPRYYNLLRYFEGHTGSSGILNTSFNLHGYPLVYSPADAIDVFLRSGLDCLALEHHLITKRASV